MLVKDGKDNADPLACSAQNLYRKSLGVGKFKEPDVGHSANFLRPRPN